jgi:hypothetical protein
MTPQRCPACFNEQLEKWAQGETTGCPKCGNEFIEGEWEYPDEESLNRVNYACRHVYWREDFHADI